MSKRNKRPSNVSFVYPRNGITYDVPVSSLIRKHGHPRDIDKLRIDAEALTQHPGLKLAVTYTQPIINRTSPLDTLGRSMERKEHQIFRQARDSSYEVDNIIDDHGGYHLCIVLRSWVDEKGKLYDIMIPLGIGKINIQAA